MFKKFITVKNQFTAFHRWEAAPDQVKFLRDFHRHIFMVETTKRVDGDDREIEFFTLKESIQSFLDLNYFNRYFDFSCEQLAIQIATAFDADTCSVSEDGENRAIVIRDHTPEALKELINNVRTEKEKTERAILQLWEVKRSRIFTGIEAEGPRRGLPTLFVPGSVTPERFEKVFRSAPPEFNYCHIYYGAGNDREIREDTLSLILAMAKDNGLVKFTVEIEKFEDIANFKTFHENAHDSNLFVVSIDKNDLENTQVHFVKSLEGKEVIWLNNRRDVYRTNLADPFFTKDTFLEE